MEPSASASAGRLTATTCFPTTTPTMPSLSAAESSLLSTMSLASSAASSFAAWLPTLAPWELYLTLTYDPKRPEVHNVRPSRWAAIRHIRRFHVQAAAITRRPTYLCGALEATRLGWPHWHGLLAAGGLSACEFALLSKSWYTAHGFAAFERIQSGTGSVVAAYCAKYLAKESSEVELLGPWQTRKAVLQGTLANRLSRPTKRR
jgi:hypothetical protein